MKPSESAAEEALLRVARDIGDAEPVRWDSVTAALREPELASRIEKLRALEELAAAFRSVPPAVVDRPTERTPDQFEWGPLQVLEKLGAGGFGEVYRAHDPVLDREVALKLRPAGPSPADRGGHRYIEEARRLARLRHPNIVSVYGAGVHGDRVGFWADLIDGHTLSDVVAEGGPFGPEEAVTIGQAVCRAMAAVHGAGLVHGDVKPSNVMRERGGRIVLIDFGAALVLRERLASGVPELLQGTPVVLAPELLAGDSPTPASDIYAVGILMYFLLTGEYPLWADSVSDLLDGHRRGEAVPLRDRRPDLSPALVEVVERALAADSAERFSSAGAMDRELGRALRGEDSASASGATAGTRHRRRRRLAWTAAALVVLVALGLAARHRVVDLAGAGKRADTHLRLDDVDPLSTFPANHGRPTFSPDGRMMAFVSDHSGAPQIWIRSVAGGDPYQVTHGETPAVRPRWSSRDEIVYARAGDGIWVVPPLGGEPRRIVERGFNPDVTPDGAWVIYERDRGLWKAAVEGGTPERLESVPSRFFDWVWATPAVSPDGTEIAYFMQEAGPTGDLWVVATGGGEPRLLTHDRVEAGDPAWSPDGSRIVFWSRRAGSKNLWQVKASGGEPRPLTVGAGEDAAPAISPDGRRLLFTNTQNRWILTALDPESGHSRDLLERRLPIWLPEAAPGDGRIAFFHPVGAAIHLFTFDLDGSGLRQVTSGERTWNIHPRFSSDGEHLYYYEERPEPALRRIHATGGESLLVASGWSWLTKMHAVPSPVGDRLAYLDQDAATGTTMVWDLAADRHVALPDPHLHGLEWSPDAAWVLGFTHGNELHLCPAAGDACRTLTSGLRPRFGPGGETVLFHRPLEQRGMWALWEIRLDGSGERRLGTTGPHGPLDPTFAVTPGGEIVYTRFEEGRSELWMGSLASAVARD